MTSSEDATWRIAGQEWAWKIVSQPRVELGMKARETQKGPWDLLALVGATR